MTPEDIARIHQFREGFELIDYGEVGLPIFRLTLETVTLAQRRIPTIQEFAMRCAELDITSLTEIASTLGLKLDVVEASASALIDAGYATFVAGSGADRSIRLTEVGEARLKDAVEEMPQDETLVIDYDAILRRPMRLPAESVVRAADLRGYGAIEIRPYPAEPPSIRELSIPDVVKVVRRQGGDDFRRTVLALKRIGRRANFFREAVALVYAADKSNEVQVAFVLGEKASEAHERIYAGNGGPRKMGFAKSVEAAPSKKSLERLVGRDALRNMVGGEELALARKQEAEARLEVQSIEPAVAAIPRRARSDSEAANALDAARQRAALAKHVLNSYSIRPLACYEQQEILDEVLGNCQRSLLVTSAGLQASILNGFRLRELDERIANKVAVRVRTYLTPTDVPRGGQRYDPLTELTKRAQNGAMQLDMMSQTEFYYLIADEELAVISNRPFFGDASRRNGFTRVSGLVIRDRALVVDILAKAIGAGPKRGRGG